MTGHRNLAGQERTQGDAEMSKRKTPGELKAMGYALADEIDTRIQPLLAMGIARENAINLTVALMSESLVIVKA
jgi:hypothetical protein